MIEEEAFRVPSEKTKEKKKKGLNYFCVEIKKCICSSFTAKSSGGDMTSESKEKLANQKPGGNVPDYAVQTIKYNTMPLISSVIKDWMHI